MDAINSTTTNALLKSHQSATAPGANSAEQKNGLNNKLPSSAGKINTEENGFKLEIEKTSAQSRQAVAELSADRTALQYSEDLTSNNSQYNEIDLESLGSKKLEDRANTFETGKDLQQLKQRFALMSESELGKFDNIDQRLNIEKVNDELDVDRINIAAEQVVIKAENKAKQRIILEIKDEARKEEKLIIEVKNEKADKQERVVEIQLEKADKRKIELDYRLKQILIERSKFNYEKAAAKKEENENKIQTDKFFKHQAKEVEKKVQFAKEVVEVENTQQAALDAEEEIDIQIAAIIDEEKEAATTRAAAETVETKRENVNRLVEESTDSSEKSFENYRVAMERARVYKQQASDAIDKVRDRRYEFKTQVSETILEKATTKKQDVKETSGNNTVNPAKVVNEAKTADTAKLPREREQQNLENQLEDKNQAAKAQANRAAADNTASQESQAVEPETSSS